MLKAKWLRFSADLTLIQISKILTEREFRRGLSSGFEPIDIFRSSLKAKFIEETINNEIYIDPFGEEFINSIRRYCIFEFQIFPSGKKNFLLRIINPPRSLKSFISLLSEVFGFGFSISEMKSDVLDLIQHIKLTTPYRNFTIRKIRISSVQLADTSIAKLEVSSSTDAYKDLKNQLNLKNSILERATIEINRHTVPKRIELSSSGMIVGDEDFIEELTPVFERYFGDK